jgi:hypothetical protein
MFSARAKYRQPRRPATAEEPIGLDGLSGAGAAGRRWLPLARLVTGASQLIARGPDAIALLRQAERGSGRRRGPRRALSRRAARRRDPRAARPGPQAVPAASRL